MTGYEEVAFVGGPWDGQTRGVKVDSDGAPPAALQVLAPGPVDPPRLHLFVEPERHVYWLEELPIPNPHRFQYRHRTP